MEHEVDKRMSFSEKYPFGFESYLHYTIFYGFFSHFIV